MNRWNKAVAAVLCLCLLCACTPPSPEPTPTPAPAPEPSYRFTRDTFPRLDGSTATVPLGQAVAAALLGEEPAQVEGLAAFTKTTQSYSNLLYGEADLLLVAEASPDVAEWSRELGVALDMRPVAAEALVFVVNADNPVDSLTAQQIRDIYSGKVTNWSQVGGEDRPITAFQRNPNSGSQVILEKEVMGDTPLAQAPTDYVISEMGALMEAVRSFDYSPGAIGYSVYYYAEDMRMAQGLKLLQVDGVAPEDGTIRAGTYPFRTAYYAVTRADQPADSPAALLRDWLLGPAGQTLTARVGYVSVLEPQADPPTDVWVDWTRLDSEHIPPDGPQPVGTHWPGGAQPALVPGPDYGPLVPYVGRQLGDTSGFSDSYQYGLMTLDGRVVTQPVYSRVTVPSYTWGGGAPILPFLVLLRGSDGQPGGGAAAVAAADGSWCTDFLYRMIAPTADNRLLVVTEDALALLDASGETHSRYTWADLGYPPGEEPAWSSGPSDNYAEWVAGKVVLEVEGETVRLLDLETGTIGTLGLEEFWDLRERDRRGDSWLQDNEWTGEGISLVKADGSRITLALPSGDICPMTESLLHISNDGGPQDWALYSLEGELLVPVGTYQRMDTRWDPITGEGYFFCVQGDAYFLLDEGGGVLHTGPLSQDDWTGRQGLCGGLIEEVSDGWAAYYDRSGACVLRLALGGGLPGID